VSLQVPNVRALEDLIFDCIYAGLIQGKLDQRAGVLRVRGALARDVRLTDVDAMLQKLEQWAAAAQQAQAALQEGAAEARQTRHCDEIAQR
jgi:COP9 signalosome complex subunit 7